MVQAVAGRRPGEVVGTPTKDLTGCVVGFEPRAIQNQASGWGRQDFKYGSRFNMVTEKSHLDHGGLIG